MTAALLSAAILLAAEPAHAQSCATAAHGEFDFVVGNWLVSDSSGRVIGTTTIRKAYGGCVLIERWRGIGKADEGLGVIGYDAAAGSWHREFIDRRGFVLAMDGRREGVSVVMTGNDHQLDTARRNRITWIPQPGGTVAYRWETSTDSGQSWKLQFDGLLRRIAE